MISSSHVVSAAPYSSGGGLLTLFPCSSMRSLSQEISTNFFNMSPFHGLKLFTNCPNVGLFPQGAVLQEQAAPVWVPHGVTSPASKPAPGRAPLSMGKRSWKELAPAQAPLGVTTSCRHPPAPVCCPFHRLQVDICSTMELTGLQGDNLPHHSLHHELQGKGLCSGTWSTSSPSFFTDLGVCRVVSFTSFHSSLLTAPLPQFSSLS